MCARVSWLFYATKWFEVALPTVFKTEMEKKTQVRVHDSAQSCEAGVLNSH